jgi:CRP-like cAMP-binding protein
MNYNKMEWLNLFSGMNSTDIRCLCDCFGIQHKTYKKGTTVFVAEEKRRHFGIITGGEALVTRWGKNCQFVAEGGYIGQFFDQAVTVTATDKLSVLLIPITKLVRQCPKVCTAHEKVLTNFIAAISDDAVRFQEHTDCLVKPNIREKALTYLLLEQSKKSADFSEEFTVSRNRSEIAAYLAVDRTALIRELSKMKDEGVIGFAQNKNVFKIL